LHNARIFWGGEAEAEIEQQFGIAHRRLARGSFEHGFIRMACWAPTNRRSKSSGRVHTVEFSGFSDDLVRNSSIVS
jgi:hypothetical protein